MAHEKAKGQQAEKLFLGSLRASRAIKKSCDHLTKSQQTPILLFEARSTIFISNINIISKTNCEFLEGIIFLHQLCNF